MDKSFIAAIVGGLITGVFSWLATNQNYKNNLRLQETKRKKDMEGLLQALHTEICVLWDRYMWGTGVSLEGLDDGEAIKWTYPLTQDNFTIYNENAAVVGLIGDDDLRNSIVTTYTKARAIIDAFRLNNDYFAKYQYLNTQHLLGSGSSVQISRELQVMERIMIDYAKKIKNIHYDVKNEVELLKRMLRIHFLTNKINEFNEKKMQNIFVIL